MRGLVFVLVGVAAVVASGAVAEGPIFHFPQVARYGGIGTWTEGKPRLTDVITSDAPWKELRSR